MRLCESWSRSPRVLILILTLILLRYDDYTAIHNIFSALNFTLLEARAHLS